MFPEVSRAHLPTTGRGGRRLVRPARGSYPSSPDPTGRRKSGEEASPLARIRRRRGAMLVWSVRAAAGPWDQQAKGRGKRRTRARAARRAHVMWGRRPGRRPLKARVIGADARGTRSPRAGPPQPRPTPGTNRQGRRRRRRRHPPRRRVSSPAPRAVAVWPPVGDARFVVVLASPVVQRPPPARAGDSASAATSPRAAVAVCSAGRWKPDAPLALLLHGVTTTVRDLNVFLRNSDLLRLRSAYYR